MNIKTCPILAHAYISNPDVAHRNNVANVDTTTCMEDKCMAWSSETGSQKGYCKLIEAWSR